MTEPAQSLFVGQPAVDLLLQLFRLGGEFAEGVVGGEFGQVPAQPRHGPVAQLVFGLAPATGVEVEPDAREMFFHVGRGGVPLGLGHLRPQIGVVGRAQQDRQQDGDDDGGGDRRPAADPFPGPLPGRRRPRPDRLAGQEATQVVRQVRGAPVAPGRLLIQTFEANRLQIARHARGQLRGGVGSRWTTCSSVSQTVSP